MITAEHAADFVVFDDVPVWKEHLFGEKGASDRVPIDRQALERVAANCNRRISETGDFCPITVRHTSEDGTFQPQVIGFAGPFHVARFGKSGTWAIKARFRIREKFAELAREHPRRSVEYWAPADDPTDGYFDPIALLGAETPELDLGVMCYSAERHDREGRVYHYQAAAGRLDAFGASSTTTPTIPAAAAPQSPSNDQETSGMLTTEDLEQIGDIVKQMVEATVDDKLAFLLPAEEEESHQYEARMSGEDDAGPTDQHIQEAPAGEKPALYRKRNEARRAYERRRYEREASSEIKAQGFTIRTLTAPARGEFSQDVGAASNAETAGRGADWAGAAPNYEPGEHASTFLSADRVASRNASHKAAMARCTAAHKSGGYLSYQDARDQIDLERLNRAAVGA